MKFTVAVDAMGGDESPSKVIKGLDLFLQGNQNLKFFKLKLIQKINY